MIGAVILWAYEMESVNLYLGQNWCENRVIWTGLWPWTMLSDGSKQFFAEYIGCMWEWIKYTGQVEPVNFVYSMQEWKLWRIICTRIFEFEWDQAKHIKLQLIFRRTSIG